MCIPPPPSFNLHDRLELLGFFPPKILIQTAQVPKLLDGAKTFPKISTLLVGRAQQRHRHTTIDRWTAHAINRT